MMRVCDKDYSCLAYRSEVFRKPPVFTWDSPCVSCRRGTERAKAHHVPEPDLEPKPLRDAGKPKEKLPPKICVCGKEISRRVTRCKKCWGLSRRVNHDKCATPGCRWLARRGGLCQTHHFAAQKAATKAYREKAHRIAEHGRAAK